MRTVTQSYLNYKISDAVRASAASPSAKVRAALLLLGNESLVELSERLGKKRCFVTDVINGRRPSPSTRQAIAADLGMDVQDIWSEAA